ncbi:hypothetical protein MJT46_015769 [Ovis ammon polii x Ovis aries]|nr:hypothetical protein MJT46_015769 [Ovis ammon polii x Ovis aries]
MCGARRGTIYGFKGSGCIPLLLKMLSLLSPWDLQRLREALPFPPFLPEVGRPLLRQVSGNKYFRRKQSNSTMEVGRQDRIPAGSECQEKFELQLQHRAASGVLVLPFRPKRLLDRDPGRSLRVVSARQTSVLFCVCPAAMPKDRERRSPSPTPTGPTSGTPARAPRVPAGLEAPVLPLLYENTPPRH